MSDATEHALRAPAELQLVNPADDVGLAPRDLIPGDIAGGARVGAPTPGRRKLAIRPISLGLTSRKYGWPIGIARENIAPDEHVHSHNLMTALSGVDSYRFKPADVPPIRAQDAVPVFDLVLAIASGRPTRAELNGERDIATWKTSVAL